MQYDYMCEHQAPVMQHRVRLLLIRNATMEPGPWKEVGTTVIDLLLLQSDIARSGAGRGVALGPSWVGFHCRCVMPSSWKNNSTDVPLVQVDGKDNHAQINLCFKGKGACFINISEWVWQRYIDQQLMLNYKLAMKQRKQYAWKRLWL